MIIKFLIKDFLSFNDQTEFSMYPGKGSSLSEQIGKDGTRDDIPALKTAVIYGANASGKSNLVKTLNFTKLFVTKGFPLDSGILYKPFKLKTENKKVHSKIEIEFKSKGNNFAYGFEFNESFIIEEWLFVINKRTDKEIFVRKRDEQGYQMTFKDVKFTTKENEDFAKFTARGTPQNRLFLRDTQERGLDFIDAITTAYDWFDSKLKIIYPKTRFQNIEFKIDENKDFANLISDFLTYFNTGIDKLVKKPIDIE